MLRLMCLYSLSCLLSAILRRPTRCSSSKHAHKMHLSNNLVALGVCALLCVSVLEPHTRNPQNIAAYTKTEGAKAQHISNSHASVAYLSLIQSPFAARASFQGEIMLHPNGSEPAMSSSTAQVAHPLAQELCPLV